MRLNLWQLSAVLCAVGTTTASPLRYFDQTILSLGEETLTRLSPAKTSIQFGDIDLTEKPVKPLDHHFPLDFLRMNVMNTSLAVEQGVISENDTDCAVRGTNTIVTVPNKYNSPSRMTFDSEVPVDYNVSQFFNFKGLTMKPVGPLQPFTVAEVHAWRIANGTALKVYNVFAVWGGKGHANPIVGDFPKFFPGWGEDVNVVEISAYTQERKPWELCIGRIEFELHENADDETLTLN
ncbi:hypothetical protein M409DRAFT_30439 [Zasmidium cellare ATCC 36951]|uniref:Uncharacterized protein n=1 Tax=Zasmidium cellare ATCC 36951 TaxID=1080233 RepID=A0A6A6BWT3_ZASCE|nr:uncharacterized protein M409DRAFT_30439 [Zasmidium cellare ATCC 36951]KAF2159155.1 hypothetical protein M409DRAFT_30439 [Zasmidium cellare ATCC 36951]